LPGCCIVVGRWHTGKDFVLINRLYSLDAAVIDLCLSVFPWARFHAPNVASSLRIGLDYGGFLPAFGAMSEARRQNIQWVCLLKLCHGEHLVVFDCGFTDCIGISN
jgi:putative transposase